MYDGHLYKEAFVECTIMYVSVFKCYFVGMFVLHRYWHQTHWYMYTCMYFTCNSVIWLFHWHAYSTCTLYDVRAYHIANRLFVHTFLRIHVSLFEEWLRKHRVCRRTLYEHWRMYKYNWICLHIVHSRTIHVCCHSTLKNTPSVVFVRSRWMWYAWYSCCLGNARIMWGED